MAFRAAFSVSKGRAKIYGGGGGGVGKHEPKHEQELGVSDISVFIKGDSVKWRRKFLLRNLHTKPETSSS